MTSGAGRDELFVFYLLAKETPSSLTGEARSRTRRPATALKATLATEARDASLLPAPRAGASISAPRTPSHVPGNVCPRPRGRGEHRPWLASGTCFVLLLMKDRPGGLSFLGGSCASRPAHREAAGSRCCEWTVSTEHEDNDFRDVQGRERAAAGLCADKAWLLAAPAAPEAERGEARARLHVK